MSVVVLVTMSVVIMPIGLIVMIGHGSSLMASGDQSTLLPVRNGHAEAVAVPSWRSLRTGVSPIDRVGGWHPGPMELDRRPGCFFDVTLRAAIRRSRDSAAEDRRLPHAGFPGPAYVWAVRPIEIFVKEVMLLPVFLIEIEGTPGEPDRVWDEAWQQIRKSFGSGRWNGALRKVEEAFGPLVPMRTDDGKDVWREWKSRVVPRRGVTVHGRLTEIGDPSSAETAHVVH